MALWSPARQVHLERTATGNYLRCVKCARPWYISAWAWQLLAYQGSTQTWSIVYLEFTVESKWAENRWKTGLHFSLCQSALQCNLEAGIVLWCDTCHMNIAQLQHEHVIMRRAMVTCGCAHYQDCVLRQQKLLLILLPLFPSKIMYHKANIYVHRSTELSYVPSLLMNSAPSMYSKLPSSLVKLKLHNPELGSFTCPVNCITQIKGSDIIVYLCLYCMHW